MLTVYSYTDPFQVNPDSTDDQVGATIALAGGSAVAFWLDERVVGPYQFNGIGLRFLDGFSPTGGQDLTVPEPAVGMSGIPDLLALSGGQLVMSWRSGATFDGMVQLFNPDGSALGSAITVAPVPVVVAQAGGGFAAAYTLGHRQNGNRADVWVQFHDSAGLVTAGPVRLNSTKVGTQQEVVLGQLGSNAVVAAWTDDSHTSADTSGSALIGRIFNPDGTAASREFLINSSFTGDQRNCALTALANGDFVAVWRSEDSTTGGSGSQTISGRVFHANGKATGAEFLIDQALNSGGPQENVSAPQVQGLLDGRFAVVWTHAAYDGFGGVTDEVLLQVFDPSGTAASVVYSIGDFDMMVNDPRVDVLADGRLIVSWDESHGALGRPDLMTQILDSRDHGINLTGNAMNNQYFGSLFADTIRGGDGNDAVHGGLGNDRLSGEADNDLLFGAEGRDVLFGNTGDDALNGAGGGDMLNGGAGNDTLIGGTGSDWFVFKPGDGADVIRKFQNGADVIDLILYQFANFNAAASHFAAHAGGVVFSDGADSILIRGLDLANLTADDLLLR